MKKEYTRFENVLNTIHDKGITTTEELKKDPQLWLEFWLAAQDFAKGFALLSKTGKTTKNGRQLVGNNKKLNILESLGITTREDIIRESGLRIAKYADNMFKKTTVAHMLNYSYSVVNSIVNTLYRRLPHDLKIVSFNGTIDETSVEAEDAYTYEDVICDNTYNPENIQNIKELQMMLEEKRAREQAEMREAILLEVGLLAKRPAEVLVHLCAKLGMKSSAIADFIIENGAVTSFAKTIIRVSEQFDIPLQELQNCIKDSMIAEKDLKLDTNDENKIINHVYHLRSRAKNRIEKTDDNDNKINT